MTTPSITGRRALSVACLILLGAASSADAAGAPRAAPAVSGMPTSSVRHGDVWRHGPAAAGFWHRSQNWDGRRFGSGRFGRDRFGRDRFDGVVFGWGGSGIAGWGALDRSWSAFSPGRAEADRVEAASFHGAVPRLRLPTAADLPVAGRLRPPVGPAVLYEIRDLSEGRSGRASGARIVSATEPTPLPGSSPSGDRKSGGPLIIHLTAR